MRDKLITKKTGNISIVISITLVMFVVSVVCVFVFNTQQLTNYVKENIGVSLFLKEDIKEEEVNSLLKLLQASNYVKSAILISKEQAAKDLQKELGGEQFVGFLGFNPLSNVIDIKLKADFANNYSMLIIEKQLLQITSIKEVYYQKNVLSSVYKNSSKILLILIIFCLSLLVIAIALIHNTIRLNIYAKRLLIKTMQLVGATSSFIFKPFLKQSIVNAIISATIALILIFGLLYYLYKLEPSLFLGIDFKWPLLFVLFILLFGTLISVLSTWLALRKYAKLSFDDLYLR